MQGRAAQHKIGASMANLDAILHQPDMRRLSMLTAHLQAVIERLDADVMTFFTVFDAHFERCRMMRSIRSIHFISFRPHHSFDFDAGANKAHVSGGYFHDRPKGYNRLANLEHHYLLTLNGALFTPSQWMGDADL